MFFYTHALAKIWNHLRCPRPIGRMRTIGNRSIQRPHGRPGSRGSGLCF